MIDRISKVTIDENGKFVTDTKGETIKVSFPVEFAKAVSEIYGGADFAIHFPASDLEPRDIETQSKITAAANAANYYGEDAITFAKACDEATAFLIGRVSAKRLDRRRMKRAERNALKVEAMRAAGVPEQTIKEWSSWLAWLLSAGSWVAPPPWNIVIAAVVFAVERFLNGGE